MSAIVRKVGRKVASDRLAEYEPSDPHYEEYTDAKGKVRRRKRAVPEGLSKRDKKILLSVRRRAHYLDKGFGCGGFRFGWTFILGLIPMAGDIAAFLLGYFLVRRKCMQAELPASLEQRMLFNNLASLGIGFVPFIGDIGTAVYKANWRNAALLEEFLVQRGASTANATETTTATTATTNEEEAARTAMAQARIDPITGNTTKPAVTQVPVDQKPKKSYGWNSVRNSEDSRRS